MPCAVCPSATSEEDERGRGPAVGHGGECRGRRWWACETRGWGGGAAGESEVSGTARGRAFIARLVWGWASRPDGLFGRLAQFNFVVHQDPATHGKDSLSCARGTRCTTKLFSIYVYLHLIIRVDVVKLSNRSETLP